MIQEDTQHPLASACAHRHTNLHIHIPHVHHTYTYTHTKGGKTGRDRQTDTPTHIETYTHIDTQSIPEERRQRKKDNLFVFVHLCPKTAHWPQASPENEMQRPGTHTARANLENLYASLILIPKPGRPPGGASTVTSWHHGAGEDRECDANYPVFHHLPKQCCVALLNTDLLHSRC